MTPPPPPPPPPPRVHHHRKQITYRHKLKAKFLEKAKSKLLEAWKVELAARGKLQGKVLTGSGYLTVEASLLIWCFGRMLCPFLACYGLSLAKIISQAMVLGSASYSSLPQRPSQGWPWSFPSYVEPCSSGHGYQNPTDSRLHAGTFNRV
ncbi:hypothetical protein ACFE04_022613 [Oxalis oulophora]